MKKFIFLMSIAVSCATFADVVKPEKVRMAVFSNNTVFTVNRAVFADGQNEVKFFDDTNFFKGSFSVWQDGIDFSVREMPKKIFNTNVMDDPNSAFAGQNVVVFLKKNGDEEKSISGKLIRISNPENKYFVSPVIVIEDQASASKRKTYINVNDIEYIYAGTADFMSSSAPASCRIFRRNNSQGALPFNFSYLAGGIDWQSSLELHLTEAGKMNMIHNAVIRNNGEKFSCPEFYLVSGSPAIAMKNITSLLCFANSVMPKTANVLMRKAAVNSSFAADAAVQESTAADDFMLSTDIIYRPLGSFAMGRNEARMIKLQSADNVAYRTAVKWQIPSFRNQFGRTVSNDIPPQPYNVLIFKNLCPSMLDSAPLSIYSDGKLMLQTRLEKSLPVNAEQSVLLSAAVGIECSVEESEDTSKREQNIIINNRRYIRSTVNAILKITNHRKNRTTVDIEYDFSGELLKCGFETFDNVVHGSSGALLNPANTLKTEVSLNSGETKELKISYTILGSL